MKIHLLKCQHDYLFGETDEVFFTKNAGVTKIFSLFSLSIQKKPWHFEELFTSNQKKALLFHQYKKCTDKKSIKRDRRQFLFMFQPWIVAIDGKDKFQRR